MPLDQHGRKGLRFGPQLEIPGQQICRSEREHRQGASAGRRLTNSAKVPSPPAATTDRNRPEDKPAHAISVNRSKSVTISACSPAAAIAAASFSTAGRDCAAVRGLAAISTWSVPAATRSARSSIGRKDSWTGRSQMAAV